MANSRTRQGFSPSGRRRDKNPKTFAPRKPKQVIFRRPWLYPEQEEFLFTKKRWSIVEAATKTGKTYGCIIWLIEMAATRGGPNKNFWWVAPSYKQAEIAFGRVVAYCPKEFVRVNNTRMTVTFANGAKIWFLSGEKPDNLYGEDVYAAVLDEATRMREGAWVAIRTTLSATRGPARIIGNVKGKKNWAYRLARKAEDGRPNWYHARLDAYAAVRAGIMPESEVEDARQTMPIEAFNELFLALASEDGANPFGHEHIEACSIKHFADGPAIAYGIDVARVVDHTVIIGLNAKLEVCSEHRMQKVDWPIQVDMIAKIIGKKPALIDSTGVGDPVTQHIQLKCPEARGFVFNNRSKQDLIEGLAIAIQRHKLGIPKDSVCYKELRDFEYEHTRTGVRYSAPEGLHDDAVCALALAYQCATDGRMIPVVRPHGDGVYAPFAV